MLKFNIEIYIFLLISLGFRVRSTVAPSVLGTAKVPPINYVNLLKENIFDYLMQMLIMERVFILYLYTFLSVDGTALQHRHNHG